MYSPLYVKESQLEKIFISSPAMTVQDDHDSTTETQTGSGGGIHRTTWNMRHDNKYVYILCHTIHWHRTKNLPSIAIPVPRFNNQTWPWEAPARVHQEIFGRGGRFGFRECCPPFGMAAAWMDTWPVAEQYLCSNEVASPGQAHTVTHSHPHSGHTIVSSLGLASEWRRRSSWYSNEQVWVAKTLIPCLGCLSTLMPNYHERVVPDTRDMASSSCAKDWELGDCGAE